jgi:hypothetical protein
MQKTIEISPSELDLVQAKIAKANKKAAALGVAPVVIESTTPFVVREQNNQDEWFYYQKLRLVLSYEPLKLGAYTFVATLDHTVGAAPIINTVPDQVVPEEYFTVASRCDHCSTSRFRKQTFLFKDDEGYKLVGRQCLKDFFGVDPTKNIDWFWSIGSFGDDEAGYGLRGENVVPVDFAVALGLVFTKRFGYVGTKQAEAYAEKSGGNASLLTTGNEVRGFLFAPPIQPTPEETQSRREIYAEANALQEQAQELVKWALEHFSGDNGSYAHNVRSLLATDVITARYVGYVVSIIAAHARATEDQAARSVVVKSNEYVGSVGDKLLVEVTVLKRNSFETDYGTTFLFVLADAAGNSLVWFASNNVLEVGETVTLKGTVKAQNDRDGRKQTVLTRCKVQ